MKETTGNTQKYLEEKKRISKVAYKLFMEKGYEKTSIKDIADAAGIQKSLVQYYYAKKDIFITQYIEDSLNIVSEEMEKQNISSGLESIFILGYFEVWYLTTQDEMKALKLDILSSRINTEVVIDIIVDWVLKFLNPRDDSERLDLENAITIAIGGCFEYLYRHMRNGDDTNIEALINLVADQMTKFIGFPILNFNIADKTTPEWLNMMSEKINNQMFGEN